MGGASKGIFPVDIGVCFYRWFLKTREIILTSIVILSMSALFSFIDLTEDDHEMAMFKYSGPDLKCTTCICATTANSRAFLSSAANELNPVGYFIITIHDISNPIDYANGAEPRTKPIRSVRNEIFQSGPTLLVLLEQPDLCPSDIAHFIFHTVKPELVIALVTIPISAYRGEGISAPQLFRVSLDDSHEVKLPPPNRITNIGAALLAYGELWKHRVHILEVVEGDSGPTLESLALFTGPLRDYFEESADILAARAFRLAQGRSSHVRH
jgi:hypothetical protein